MNESFAFTSPLGVEGDLTTMQMIARAFLDAKQYEKLIDFHKDLQELNDQSAIDPTLDTLMFSALTEVSLHTHAAVFVIALS